MKLRVLVVDDSKFFRRRVTEIINANSMLEVVGAAENGEEAVRKVVELKPDVIIMDIEMPVMDGITAVRKIMQVRPTPVVMFSSLTTDGARATLDALDAGAADFLPKRFEDIAKDKDVAKRLLCEKVYSIGRMGARAPSGAARKPEARPAPAVKTVMGGAPAHKPAVPASKAPAHQLPKGAIKLVAIGTSTGGPVALQKVLTGLPENFPVPVLVIQHMPGTFTPAFSQRLDQACKIHVKEAADGDVLQPGTAYVAPGGRQMLVENHAGRPTIRVRDGDPSLNYKPSVDITFKSVNEVFPGKTLAVVMTGMGADGREGARALKAQGAEIWAQDEKSCVVYGMPCAIVEAGIADQVYDLAEIGDHIVRKVM